ncbi:MAG: asparaginase domain-containing protein [Gemmobacter sp.]|nr:asparaginase domain-containing protein [Gemmobacter sp.]
MEAAVAARLPAGAAREVLTFEPLLDSADIGASEWNRVMAAILARPGADVVVTHGTDTMAFTGAALTQALAGSERRVVLCGAMHPLGTGGDAEGNLDQALKAARNAAPGVWLAFAGLLLPAGALAKVNSHAAEAFIALPEVPPPVRVPRPAPFAGRRLAILTLSPGLPAAALAAMLAELDGAVLRVFGAGTAMNDPALLDALRRAVARGVRLRAVSQCLRGGLEPGAYAAGEALWAAGVENGGMETAEAALVRLWLDLSM